MSAFTTLIKKRQNILVAFVAGLTLVLVSAFIYFAFFASSIDVDAKLAECEQFTQETKKIDCWYQVMRTVHNAEGTAAAFDVFNTLYENEPLFVETGCHLHAHRIGDFSYYDSYVVKKDLDEIEFPKGSEVCGSGFYHGFFEHLIQDNADPDYVVELCNYFDKRLSQTMPGMRITCFHGSGHGFALAEIDEGAVNYWGDYNGIIEDPLRLCEQLDAKEGEIEECRQGVFNVLVLWMESGEYGLEYDWEDPFWLCEDQKERHKMSCYYEVGQKMDRVSNWDLDKALEVLNDIPEQDQKYVGMLLGTTLGGYLQTTITEDKQFDYMERCVDIREELQRDCISGVVGGLMEHGDPGDEHIKTIEICSLPYLNDQQRRICFESLEMRLHKFHSNEKIREICEASDSKHFKEACEWYDLS